MGQLRAGGRGDRRPASHASRLDGSPLAYNHADPYLPDLVICRPELAEQVLEIVSRYT